MLSKSKLYVSTLLMSGVIFGQVTMAHAIETKATNLILMDYDT